jgi:hypothetical protein
MTYLKDVIHDVIARSYRVRLKDDLAVVGASRQVEEKFGGFGRIPSAIELDAVYKAFLRAIKMDNWEQITNKEWKRAALVLFWEEDAPLVSSTQFNDRFNEWISKKNSTSVWKRLIYSYLLHFEKADRFPKVFQAWQRLINRCLDSQDMPKSLLPWKERHERFNLFRTGVGVEKIITHYIEVSDWLNFCSSTGIKNELEKRGYITYVARGLIEKLKACDLNQVSKVRDFFCDVEEFRLPEFKSHLIDGLLLRWRNEMPPNTYKKELQDWLIDRFGDPRLIQVRQRDWRSVSQESIDVFKKWMVEETLDQFFAIIDQEALEHHWIYRKKFWKAYFNEGVISDACVILGVDAQRAAQRAFGKNISMSKISAGQHSSNQSVLLIKIDQFIFCEWSHNGKCRVWKKGDANCPDLHLKHYSADELRSKSMRIVDSYQQDGIVHAQSANYSWQTKLASFIRRQTGIRMEQRKYALSAQD